MHELNPTDAQRVDDRNLYAPLRTAAEAQQQTLHRGVWPLHSACNRNCVQGRMCDCVPAVEIEDGAPRKQRVPEGGAVALLLSAAIVAALAALVLMLR